jgi:hypothetical protein
VTVHTFEDDPLLAQTTLLEIHTPEHRIVHLRGVVSFDCVHGSYHVVPVNIVCNVTQEDDLWRVLDRPLLAREMALAHLTRGWVDACPGLGD